MTPSFLAIAALLGFVTLFFFMGHSGRISPAMPAKGRSKSGSNTTPGSKTSVGSRTNTGSRTITSLKSLADPNAKLAGTWPPKNSTPVTHEPDAFAPAPAVPELDALVWESPVPSRGPITLTRESERRDETVPKPETTSGLDAGARRIRERYLAARFPGVLRSTTDLADTERIIKCARLLFEDGFASRAGELLDLVSEEHPESQPAWLANLEITFLDRNPERYVRLAHAFFRAHPESPDWPEVARLGRRVAPMHPRFAQSSADQRDDEHIGPWPQMPNWIQANWDLTGELAASELRARLIGGAPMGSPSLQKAA
ncbi:hypothetical protein DSM104443_01798 [Usitatibacter rugosus]|uniref:Uncharacterized protein n=1 Tax=Usitatibacter rugosus TaxID=2732067 RepID=A0A6M4GTR1_9PROT|nr:hypothetical protein [Usitatibacter rugosus]QJR10729.1 hypothetical protein DSM104443_01798 [Usitatibacter rugosus]